MIRAILLTGILLFPILLAGQQVTVQPVKELPEKADPGDVVTLSFLLSTTQPQTTRLQPRMTIPAGWRLFTAPRPGSLAEGGRSVLVYSFIVPSSCAAGSYPLWLHVLQDRDTLAFWSASLEVGRSYRYEVSLLGMPEYLMAGESAELQVMVRNTSNSAHSFLLRSQAAGPAPLTPFTIPPDSLKVISLLLTTDPEARRSTMNSLGVNVHLADTPFSQVSAYGTYSVLPVAQARQDLYQRFPVAFTANYLRNDRSRSRREGYQLGVSGRGALDARKRHVLEFMARGPNQFETSSLGTYDQHFLGYEGPWLKLAAGDQIFHVSRLLESSRFARGMQASVRRGGLEAGAMSYQPRFYKDITSAWAGYASYELPGRFTIGLNYLNKELQEQRGNAALYSATVKGAPYQWVNLEAELAQGKLGERQGMAYYGGLDLRVRSVSLHSSVLRAGMDYPGYYSNTANYAVNLNATLSRRFTTTAGFNQDRSNLALDTLFYAAPLSSSWYASLTYMTPRRFQSTLRAGTREREDRMEPRAFHYQEDFVNLILSNEFRKFSASLQSEVAESRNLLRSQAEGLSFNVHGVLSWVPSRWVSLNAFASSLMTTRYSESRQTYWYYGGTAKVNTRKHTSAFITLRNSFQVEDYYLDRSFVDAGLIQRIGRHQEINFASQYGMRRGQLEGAEWSIRLGYALRIGVPLRKTGDPLGSLSGRISSADGDLSVEGLVLRINGYTAVTDKEGNYSFYNLPKGDYMLVIDRTSLGMSMMSAIPLPVRFSLGPGENRELSFEVMKGASLRGKLILNGNGHKEKEGVPNGLNGTLPSAQSARKGPLTEDQKKEFVQRHFVIVEISNGQEKHRTITNSKGEYVFSPLRPGDWAMKIYRNGMPKEYHLDQDEFIVHLMPGEGKEINLVLSHRERNIRFQTQPVEVKVNNGTR